MPNFARPTYWIKMILGVKNSWKNALTTDTLKVPAGADMDLRFGLYKNGTKISDDLSDVTSFLVEVKAYSANNPPLPSDGALISKTVNAAAFNSTSIADDDFRNQSDYHFGVTLSEDESNLTVTGPSTKYWLVVSAAMVNGDAFPVAWGAIEFVQDGSGNSSVVPAPSNTITSTAVAANYLALSAARHYIPFAFPGRLAISQKRGYFKATVDLAILGIQIDAVDGVSGADLQGKVIDASAAELVTAQVIVADGASYGQLIFVPALNLTAGDEILIELTAVGTTTPGEFMSGSWITRPLQQS